ncbi:gluconeogenesis factor YvcK family protein [Clostridium sp.]|uniref:gluconeogenesis factor YvcK family protein n=1 Tax=Clostridium sp. TaxID=1506 RepID=UPI003216D16B
MKHREWLTPGIGIKRWIFQMLLGVFLVSYAIIEFIREPYGMSTKSILFCVLVLGGILTYTSLKKYTKQVMAIIRFEALNFSAEQKNSNDEFFEKSMLVKGPKIVVIGGGTGLSNMLSGLKKYTSNITAVVTVADDGGGSGVLRQDLGMLPPGDIRNCIISLADTEPLMEQLFRYRFKDGSLENQSFGNLFLAAMNGISDNFLEAIKKTSDVLAVTGEVLPVTLENVELYAKLKNGDTIRGESSIPKESVKRNSPIEEVFIEPRNAKGVKEAIDAISDADAVILGPGSLYTSIIPNLMVEDIKEAIKSTKALKFYIANIMTQHGESDNFSVQDHIRAIMRHCEGVSIDYTIVNKGLTEEKESIKEKYLQKGSTFVTLNHEDKEKLSTKYIECDMIKIKKGLIRHDENKLAQILMETIMRKKLIHDDKRVFEYIYLVQRLRKENKDRE